MYTGDERFAESVKRLREAAELSQAELAARIGRSQQAVAQIENRRRRVTIGEAVEIARALGTSLVYMVATPRSLAEDEVWGERAFDEAAAFMAEHERLVALEERLLRLINETRPTDGEH